MKNKILGGIIIAIIFSGIWFLFVRDNSITIEEIENTQPIEQPDFDILSMNYTDIIDDDVFIGDTEEEEEKKENKAIHKKYKTLIEKYTKAFAEKDFKTVCSLTSQCNENSTDAQKLATKEKQYKMHSFEFWTSTNNENILCYKESIQLKNDSNTNPTIYTYSVSADISEFKKPSCEKVEKAPYGDITNNDPHNKRCGLNKKLCTQ